MDTQEGTKQRAKSLGQNEAILILILYREATYPL